MMGASAIMNHHKHHRLRGDADNGDGDRAVDDKIIMIMMVIMMTRRMMMILLLLIEMATVMGIA